MKPYLIGFIILVSGLVINKVLVSMGLIYYGEVALFLLALIIASIYIKTSDIEITSKDIRKIWLIIFIGLVTLQFISQVSTNPYFSMGRAIFTSVIGGLVSSIIAYVGLIIPVSFSKKYSKKPVKVPNEES